MNAESYLQSGDLAACKEQLFKQIKLSPSDVKLRIFLFQLFCIHSEWDRALTQLEVIRDLDDASLALVNTYEQIIACEQIRQKVLSGEKDPTCFGEPSNWMAYYAQANQHHVKGDFEAAEKLALQGAELAPQISGNVDDKPFEWMCDGDARFGPSIEVMLNNSYYWLPMENIKKLEFEPVEDLRDLVWRPANLTLKNMGKMIVFVPVRYPTSDKTTDPQRLSRTCDWDEPVKNYYIGNGQRIFMTDDSEYPLLDVKTIEFEIE